MRVGIFGGTFDPIHLGHLLTAESALEKFSLDSVIFIPANHPPHKIEQSIVSADSRYKMVELAIKDNEKFQISDIELKRNGPSYSIDTINELKEKHIDADFFFITGADAINDLATWHEAKTLLESCHFIAASRPNIKLDMDLLAKKFGALAKANINELDTRRVEISSTEIRDRIRKGKNISYMVPAEVFDYIKCNSLYKLDAEGMRELLKSSLKESRYAHSLGVANTAVILAKRFGIDPKKAYIAGLLHDSAREFENDELIAEAEKRGIEVGEIERKMPILIHAALGSLIAFEKYGVSDDDILNAINTHTVGGKNMSPLQKIIYFADMIEPNRDYPGVDELREYVKDHTLDEIMIKAFSDTIAFTAKKGGIIHPTTISARNELLGLKEIL